MRTSLVRSWSCTGGIIVQPVGRLRFFWSGRLVSEDASRLSDSSITVPLSILPDPPYPLSYLSLFYHLIVVYFISRISVGKLIKDASDYYGRIQTQSHEMNTDPGVCLFSILQAYYNTQILSQYPTYYCIYVTVSSKDIVDRFCPHPQIQIQSSKVLLQKIMFLFLILVYYIFADITNCCLAHLVLTLEENKLCFG